MAKKDFMKEIKEALKEKKEVMGTKESIKLMKQGQLVTVFLSSNTPSDLVDEITKYGKMTGTVVSKLDIPNDELGTVCRKPYSISVLSIKK